MGKSTLIILNHNFAFRAGTTSTVAIGSVSSGDEAVMTFGGFYTPRTTVSFTKEVDTDETDYDDGREFIYTVPNNLPPYYHNQSSFSWMFDHRKLKIDAPVIYNFFMLRQSVDNTYKESTNLHRLGENTVGAFNDLGGLNLTSSVQPSLSNPR